MYSSRQIFIKNATKWTFSLLITVSLLLSGCSYSELTTSGFGVVSDQWIMPDSDEDMPVWGIKKGIVLGIYPSRLSFGDISGGPRGLFRVGFESNGTLRFVNFMAVHPVNESKGKFVSAGSELEKSPSDNRRGIRFYPYPVDYLQNPKRYHSTPSIDLAAEILKEDGRQILQWGIKTEAFENGVEAFFVFRIDEHRFNEIQIESYILKGEKKVKYLVLSATFGNITRLRNLYLKDEIVFAPELYKGKYGKGFAPRKFFDLEHWPVDSEGDSLFIAGPDEYQPWKVKPYPHKQKLLQYFRKEKGATVSDIRGLVNGREKYWHSIKTIPGGVAFENFAIVERFYQGQRFSFGIYRGQVEDIFGRRFKRK